MFTASLERWSNVFCSHISPWADFLLHKSNLFIEYRMYRWALCFQEIIKEIKGPQFIQTNSFQLTLNCILPRRLLKTDVWLKWNSNETGVFMPLIKRIYSTKDSSIPIQFRRDKNGRCLCILRLQSIYILYIQTNLLEKLKGWHSQSWIWWWPLLWTEMHV